ncbi:helicase [Gordoniibacillus kamchatkensis]|uniref:Helicase n=1 Tax=Gordoniibacillus kamchatkensis TaxID=1590651 RepID=A0ABR5ABZ5_9BACL|nr:RNA polymerase recycling motor HelD [Paenibacillus sp. VKM B-2647]KIL37902.1 helicase [Paenibacillus sp. VKM B-2647]
MSGNVSEREAEQQRVTLVQHIIASRMEELAGQLSEMREEVVDIRKHFWDDVTVNLDDMIETQASMKQQSELLAERERGHSVLQRQYKSLQRLQQSPYFGRIDFREQGDSAAEVIYLGTASLLGDDGESLLIYDWRAPISSLYYDYGPGPAEYDTPSGKIAGTMELKRQFVFKHGAIEYMFDTSLTIGDEILQQVLAHSADGHMKNIVATIQRDQNRVIREDRKRCLIVSGPAGSGKTSAALQRVAYLLYKYRRQLTADQIVLFSPNPMFKKYVSTVLPDLGEENMQQSTFQEYLEHRLADRFQLEDPFAQLETALTGARDPGYEARLEGIRFKSSARFFRMVQRYKTSLERQGLIFRDVKVRGHVLLSAKQLEEWFYPDGNPGGKLAPRVAALLELVLKEAKKALFALRDEPWVEEEVELLGRDDYDEVYRRLQKAESKGNGTFNERREEAELLKELVLDRYHRRLRKRLKRFAFLDFEATYLRLFEDPALASSLLDEDADADGLPMLWPEICRQTVEKLQRRELSQEDATPFLYLKGLIEGFHVNLGIRHVFIDEAQDYSPFQYEFLKQLFPRGRMTLLGDHNQIINAYSAVPGLETLTGLYGEEETEVIRFTKSYRSTKPITDFTRELLPEGRNIEPFERAGEKPAVTAAADEEALYRHMAGRIRELKQQRYGTIAVIGKTAQECAKAYESLKPLMDENELLLITKETDEFTKGGVVIPSYLAKGIEFDAVLIHDASQAAYARETERQLFYISCTRAMHRLYLYYVGELSPFVRAVNPELYVRDNASECPSS